MKKTSIAIILIFCLLAAAGAYIVNYVISNHVIVEVEGYSVTLLVDENKYVVGDTIKFYGNLTSPNFYLEGANVTLWRNGTYTGYSNFTGAYGYYEIFYNTTEVGTFDFYANATITS